MLTTTVEVATISCWYGVWVLSDRASDFARIDQERQWETAAASLVSQSDRRVYINAAASATTKTKCMACQKVNHAINIGFWLTAYVAASNISGTKGGKQDEIWIRVRGA